MIRSCVYCHQPLRHTLQLQRRGWHLMCQPTARRARYRLMALSRTGRIYAITHGALAYLLRFASRRLTVRAWIEVTTQPAHVQQRRKVAA